MFLIDQGCVVYDNAGIGVPVHDGKGYRTGIAGKKYCGIVRDTSDTYTLPAATIESGVENAFTAVDSSDNEQENADN